MGESKSCGEAKKRQFGSTEVQNSLKEEILQLQKQLEEQYVMRCAPQKGSRYKPLFHEPTNGNSNTKPAEDLIKEISILELEVVHLEKYLFSMYRKTCSQSASSFSTNTKDERSKDSKSVAATLECISSEFPGHHLKGSSMTKSISLRLQPQVLWDNPSKECSKVLGAQPLLDSSIHRSHSSLSQTADCSFRTSPPRPTVAEAAHSYHSLPLSMLERAQDSTSNISLAEHFATDISVDQVQESPNWISEEMIKCISAIYCQLSEPPLFNHGFPSSPISFSSSSTSESPPQGQYGRRNPQSKENSSFNSCLNNPFCFEDSKELSGSYSTTVEIQGICRDTWRMRGVEHMLRNFRSLVCQLEEVDPRKMKQEEKLAFWINVHNVLVMHAFLVDGIPQSNMNRSSLLLKAAYTIGGHTISIDMIQNSILGCRLPRPGQWFQSLFFPKSKFKARDAPKVYAIGRLQPLLYFALSSGSQSDPMKSLINPKTKAFFGASLSVSSLLQNTVFLEREKEMDVEGIGLVLARASELRSKITNSIQNSSDHQIDLNVTKEERENEDEASLSNIRDAFDLLEAQLSSLQALQQQQFYEREAALAEIDYSRQKLLKKLKEYKGEDLEVISEATAFASETVEDNNDLLLPPYPSRPSHLLVSGNGYLSHSPATRKFPQNGVTNGDPSNELRMGIQESERIKPQSETKSSLRLFINVATKTVLALVGVVSVLSLAGFEPRLRKRDTQFKVSGLFQQQGIEAKRPMVDCPPGKVLVFEDGETRCLVKERVEIPFDSVVATPDVNYGCG